MAEHNTLGNWGEGKSVEHLISKGYDIRHRNWRYGHRDIDVVAVDKNGAVVFVEVKTRRNNVFNEPEQAVDKRKVRSLMIAANAYVKLFKINAEIRFDIITVVGIGDENFKINHIEDAFLPLPY